MYASEASSKLLQSRSYVILAQTLRERYFFFRILSFARSFYPITIFLSGLGFVTCGLPA